MNSNKQHKKVSLSNNGDCRVVFCPDCGTLEINLGTSTIRTDYQSLQVLSSVLNHSKVRLAKIHDASTGNGTTQQMRRIGRVH